jgi:hypothetical protein
LASILDEEDWCVGREPGIGLYEIERHSVDGPYKMLHLVMQVHRKVPAREQRAPGQNSDTALASYDSVVEGLFLSDGTAVTDGIIDRAALQSDLDTIKALRREIYPEGEDISSAAE